MRDRAQVPPSLECFSYYKKIFDALKVQYAGDPEMLDFLKEIGVCFEQKELAKEESARLRVLRKTERAEEQTKRKKTMEEAQAQQQKAKTQREAERARKQEEIAVRRQQREADATRHREEAAERKIKQDELYEKRQSILSADLQMQQERIAAAAARRTLEEEDIKKNDRDLLEFVVREEVLRNKEGAQLFCETDEQILDLLLEPQVVTNTAKDVLQIQLAMPRKRKKPVAKFLESFTDAVRVFDPHFSYNDFGSWAERINHFRELVKNNHLRATQFVLGFGAPNDGRSVEGKTADDVPRPTQYIRARLDEIEIGEPLEYEIFDNRHDCMNKTKGFMFRSIWEYMLAKVSFDNPERWNVLWKEAATEWYRYRRDMIQRRSRKPAWLEEAEQKKEQVEEIK